VVWSLDANAMENNPSRPAVNSRRGAALCLVVAVYKRYNPENPKVRVITSPDALGWGSC
jgi:hypothetical protein